MSMDRDGHFGEVLSFLWPPTFLVWRIILNPLISATPEWCADMSVSSVDRLCQA